MRAVIQRVKRASVSVEEQVVGQINAGLCCLIGVEEGDDAKDIDYLARKIMGLRIFEDEHGTMNLDVQQVGGELLLVSQFTLLGDCRKGRRPSYARAGKPEDAKKIFDQFVEYVENNFEGRVATGQFQAMMDVDILNNGPVTLMLDSRKGF